MKTLYPIKLKKEKIAYTTSVTKGIVIKGLLLASEINDKIANTVMLRNNE
jgi:hypothetical protein